MGKNDITIYNYHTLPACSDDSDGVYAMFIDPGTKNCGLRMVRRENSVSKTILHELAHFSKVRDPLPVSMAGATRYLETIKPLLCKCHYIVFERQMKVNYDVTRMAQHLESVIGTMTIDKGNRPLIIEVSSRLKSKAFLTKGKDTKDSGVIAARRIASERGDTEILALIDKTKKKDDICDVVCYEDLWWDMIIEFNMPRVTNRVLVYIL